MPPNGRWGRLPKSAATPLFGLDAVLFHRGQAGQPHPRRQSLARSSHETDWEDVAEAAPVLAATCRRYLQQLGVSLRPKSVAAIDITLRQFAGFLVAADPPVTRIADVGRPHIEAFKTHISVRGGYKTNATLSKTTIGMRMGHLARVLPPHHRVGLPRRAGPATDHAPTSRSRTSRCHGSSTTPSAAKFIAAARNLPEQFGRLAIELLARTGMRKGELLGLTIDAVVQIGSAFWLRIPVGKIHTDRYIPLHPPLKQMIDRWLAGRPDWQTSDLLFTDRGRPIPPPVSTKPSKKPLPQQVSATSTPTNSDTPWPPRRSTAA